MIKNWLQLIRFPNLMIIALTQCLMQLLLLQPVFYQNHLNPVLQPIVFAQLVLLFVLAGAGGYIINDIKDRFIDSVNKPTKLLVGKKISVSLAQKSYLIILVFSTLIALNLASLFLKSLIIGFILNGLLWLYAQYLKQTVLIGNLTVTQLVRKNPYLFLVDLGVDLNPQNTFVCPTAKIPEDYLPTEDSFYDPEQYEPYAIHLKNELSKPTSLSD